MPFRTRPDSRLEFVCPCGCGKATEWKMAPEAPRLAWYGKRDQDPAEAAAEAIERNQPRTYRSVGEILANSYPGRVTPVLGLVPEEDCE